MSVTPRLSLPLLAAGQAQKHVTHNDALTRLDALIQLAVRQPHQDRAAGRADRALRLSRPGGGNGRLRRAGEPTRLV